MYNTELELRMKRADVSQRAELHMITRPELQMLLQGMTQNTANLLFSMRLDWNLLDLATSDSFDMIWASKCNL